MASKELEGDRAKSPQLAEVRTLPSLYLVIHSLTPFFLEHLSGDVTMCQS